MRTQTSTQSLFQRPIRLLASLYTMIAMVVVGCAGSSELGEDFHPGLDTPGRLAFSGSLQSSVYELGAVPAGESLTQTITVVNESPNQGVQGISATLESPFSFKGGTYPGTGGDCTDALGPGASCTVVIIFTPPPAGNATGTVIFSYNNSRGADGVNLPIVGRAPAMESLEISPSTPSIAKGLTQNFTATAYYGDGSAIDVTDRVTWSASNSNVTTSQITGAFRASAVALGDVTISATLDRLSSSTIATVGAQQLVSIALSATDSTVHKYERIQLTATGTFTDGSTSDVTSSITSWSSGDTSIAVVSSGGLVTGVDDLGIPVTITARLGSISGSMDIGLAAGLFMVSLAPANSTVHDQDSSWCWTVNYAATGTYFDASTANITTQVAWSTLNASGGSWSSSISSSGVLIACVTGVNENATASLTVKATFPQYAADGSVTYVTGTASVSYTHDPEKVLCTELHHQGLLPDDIYAADAAFGRLAPYDTVKNYQAWAIPVVRLMRKYPLVTTILKPLIRSWAYHMAYKMGMYPEPNVVGEFLLLYGVPTSNVVGGTIRVFTRPGPRTTVIY